MGYRALAKYLGPDQPVIGVKAYPPKAADAPPTIEEMAERYQQEVQAHQPEGPYVLAGYSMGAFIAVEMARRFKANGAKVGLLAAIDDGPALLSDRPGLTWEELCRFGANVPRWLAFQFAMRPLADIARDAWRKLRSWTRFGPGDVSEVLDPQRFSPLMQPTLTGHYRAVKGYRPAAYDGPITLFRARVQPLFGSHQADLGWSPVAADGVTVHVIPGNHDSLLDEPFVKALAKQLNDALSRVSLRRLGELNGELVKLRTRT
jgi:thioesterase domain-containing protein